MRRLVARPTCRSGYPDSGSQNQSGLHWDMICDLREGGEVHVDGELFQKDGEFTV